MGVRDRRFAEMRNAFARNVHVVEATKDGQTEYWAAATHRDDTVVAVLSQFYLIAIWF